MLAHNALTLLDPTLRAHSLLTLSRPRIAAQLPRLADALRKQLEGGGFVGAQLALRFGKTRPGGEGTDWSADGAASPPPLDMCIGNVRGNEPMQFGHLANWMSTTKPLAAIAIAQLEEKGLLHVDDPVARHLPRFGQMGKGAVTIRHLLTHTAGVPYADIECWGSLYRWDLIVRTICDAPLADGWVPGKRCGYHTYSAWFILGELVKVVSGLPYERYVQDRIFGPLGLLPSVHVVNVLLVDACLLHGRRPSDLV